MLRPGHDHGVGILAGGVVNDHWYPRLNRNSDLDQRPRISTCRHTKKQGTLLQKFVIRLISVLESGRFRPSREFTVFDDRPSDDKIVVRERSYCSLDRSPVGIAEVRRGEIYEIFTSPFPRQEYPHSCCISSTVSRKSRWI